MEQINNDLDRSVKSIVSAQQSAVEPESAKPKRRYREKGELLTVEEIFWKRMAGLYGYTFTRQFGEVPTREWEMAIDGLAMEQIAKGLKAMATSGRYSDFPPTPLSFRAMCLPSGEELGLPSEEEAFQQAVGNRTRKHPSVIHTLRHTDSFALCRLDTLSARQIWGKAWAETVSHVMAGGELPEPEPEIEHKPTRAKPEAAQPYLDQLMGMFGDA